MSQIALTTVFTPPASCFDNSYTSVGGSVYVKDTAVASSECYPSSFHSLWQSGLPFSPGVCPDQYTTARASAYSANDDATAAICCPSGFSNPGNGDLGCFSVLDSSTVLATPGGQAVVTAGAQLAFHGVYVVFSSGNVDSATTSATPAPTPRSSTVTSTTQSSASTSTTTSPTTSSSSPRSSVSEKPSSAPSGTTEPTTQAVSPSVTTLFTSIIVLTSAPSTRSIASQQPPFSFSETLATFTEAPATSTSPAAHTLSMAAKAGTGAGAAIGGLLLLAGIGWVVVAWGRRNRPKPSELAGEERFVSADAKVAVQEHKRNISELSSEGSVTEAGSRAVRAELAGS